MHRAALACSRRAEHRLGQRDALQSVASACTLEHLGLAQHLELPQHLLDRLEVLAQRRVRRSRSSFRFAASAFVL